MKMRFLVLLAASAVGAFWLNSACPADDWRRITPLPDDVTVEPMPTDLSSVPKIAKLSGAWHGYWRVSGSVGALIDFAGPATTIVVERVIGRNVQAVYSVGGFEQSKPGWMRILGRIDGNTMVFVMGPNQGKLTLKLNRDDSATAEIESGAAYLKAQLDRKTLNTAQPDSSRFEKEEGSRHEEN